MGVRVYGTMHAVAERLFSTDVFSRDSRNLGPLAYAVTVRQLASTVHEGGTEIIPATLSCATHRHSSQRARL